MTKKQSLAYLTKTKKLFWRHRCAKYMICYVRAFGNFEMLYGVGTEEWEFEREEYNRVINLFCNSSINLGNYQI